MNKTNKRTQEATKEERTYIAYVYQRATLIYASSYLRLCISEARTYSKLHPCSLIFVDKKQPDSEHLLAFIDGHDATLPSTTDDVLFYAGIKPNSKEKPYPQIKALMSEAYERLESAQDSINQLRVHSDRSGNWLDISYQIDDIKGQITKLMNIAEAEKEKEQ